MNNPFLLSLLPASQSLTNQRQSAEESQFTFAGLQGLDTLVQNPYFRLTGVKIYGQIPALYGEQGIPNLYSFDDTFDDDDSPFTAWRLHTITLSPKSPATVGDKEYYWKLARPQDRRTPLGEEYWAVALEYNDGTREFPIFLKTASWPELKKGVRGKEFIEIRSPSGKFYKLPRQGLKTIRIYAKQPELGELTTNVLVFENDLDQLLEARKALQDVQRKMGDWKLLYRFNPERQVFILDVLPQKKLSQNLPLDEEYVKLKISSDDLGYNPFGVSEHIYVPKSIIEAVSNYFRKPSNGLPDCLKNRPPPNSDECLFHGVQPKPEDEDSDKPYLWVRNDQGRPYRIWAVSPRTKVKPESSAWQEYWKDLYKAGIRSMGVGRPPRYLDPEIELFLLPEKSFEKEFGGWVNFINSELENTARTGNRAPQNNQTVTVIDQHPGTLLYKQIGTSPFGHYHTFVRKRVYDDYIEKHPSYQFPDMANEENGRFTHLLADRSKNPVLKAMEDAVKKIDLDNQVGWPTLLRSQVSAVGIQLARGVRKQTTVGGKRNWSQFQVMKRSASEIAKALEWPGMTAGSSIQEGIANLEINDGVPRNWPKPSFAQAEWLHRSAYSWGGLLGENETPTSSQIFQNLIFGSSECNSLMTRFEESWQRLLWLSGARGHLESRVLGQADQADSTDFADLGWERDLEFWGNRNLGTQEILNNHWLCKGLVFRLRLSQDVELSTKKKGILKGVQWTTIFYPFQRPFFTRFESELDMYILKVAFGVNSTKTVTPTKDSDVFATDEPSTSDTSRGESGMAEAKDPGTIFKESQGTQMEDADAGLPKKKLHIEQCPVSASSISVTGEFSPLHDELSLRI